MTSCLQDTKLSITQTNQAIQATSSTVKPMGMATSRISIKQLLKACGKMTHSMALASRYYQMALKMRVIIKWVRGMEKLIQLGLMALHSKEHGMKIKSQAQEPTFGQMGEATLVSG